MFCIINIKRIIYISFLALLLYPVCGIAQDFNKDTRHIVKKSIEYIIEGNEYIGVQDKFKNQKLSEITRLYLSRLNDSLDRTKSTIDDFSRFSQKLSKSTSFDQISVDNIKECPERVIPGNECYLDVDHPMIVIIPNRPNISSKSATIQIDWIIQYEKSIGNLSARLELQKIESVWRVERMISYSRE